LNDSFGGRRIRRKSSLAVKIGGLRANFFLCKKFAKSLHLADLGLSNRKRERRSWYSRFKKRGDIRKRRTVHDNWRRAELAMNVSEGENEKAM
jgi:hypothetical protein